MPASADVIGHLDRHHASLRETFRVWRDVGDLRQNRTGVIEDYFEQVNLGDVQRLGANSVALSRRRAPDYAPTALIIGSHDTGSLTPVDLDTITAAEEMHSPGSGSLLGSTVAFLEGFKATVTSTLEEPIQLHAISVGPGDTVLDVVDSIDTDKVDVVFFTNAVAWDPLHPTMTTGSRGRLEAEITLQVTRAINDTAYAGVTRNPMNRLLELVADLRGDNGRIAIPGFYERAVPPERGAFDELSTDWLTTIGATPLGGSLSPIERSTQWPVISVLSVSDSEPGDASIPRHATARVAIHLVPDQRPVAIEQALRAWLTEQIPDNVHGSVKISSASRPYRCTQDTPAFAAQVRALHRVHGRSALPVPGGGPPGAGEVHYATGAPVMFAGICGPSERWGTSSELLSQELFDNGTQVAAETCLQLTRRTTLRSTS